MTTLRYRHTADFRSGVLVVRYEGTITHSGIWEELRAFVRLPPQQRALPKRLFDMRGCRFEITTQELLALRNASEGFLASYPILQTAFVADSDLGFGLVRMYLLRSDNHPVKQSVFRNLANARASLGMDPEATDEGEGRAAG